VRILILCRLSVLPYLFFVYCYFFVVFVAMFITVMHLLGIDDTFVTEVVKLETDCYCGE